MSDIIVEYLCDNVESTHRYWRISNIDLPPSSVPTPPYLEYIRSGDPTKTLTITYFSQVEFGVSFV